MPFQRYRIPRGFTLIELGIILGVISILLVTVVTARMKALEGNRAIRTAAEMTSMADHISSMVQGQIILTNAIPPVHDFEGFALHETDATCFDLSNITGIAKTDCPSTGNPGATWTAPAHPFIRLHDLNPPNALLEGIQSAGGQIYGGGYNAWCIPYIVCLYKYRTDIVTCVPDEARNSGALRSAHDCGSCGALDNVLGRADGSPGYTCKFTGVPNMRDSIQRTESSYTRRLFSNDELRDATVY